MNTFKTKSAIFLGTFVLVLLIASLVLAGDRVYSRGGKISAINLLDNVVVIEIPVPNDSMTVGGALAPNAKVTKGNRPATLDDFKVGETVNVRWRVTETGHTIEGLSG
ncbi:MAG: hypothetical protein PVI06_00160 [Desulfobacterales bacterium]|jgi:hypothetical protein